MTDINAHTKEDFLEATAKSFEALEKSFDEIKMWIEEDELDKAKAVCVGSAAGCFQCAQIVRERESA